jgi:lactoylglutathione lyase
MITIEHLAIWVEDLEKMKTFYEFYFQAKAGQKYYNPHKNFTSYFLSFGSGPRLELMHKHSIPPNLNNPYDQQKGLIHFAISLGSENKVNFLTERLRHDGYEVISDARWTGDGYYESVVLDPEKNRIEITI